MPDESIDEILKQIAFVPLTAEVASLSLAGPTSDFEDNVQLHSCAASDCDFFLTSDKNLLKLKFFGKAHVLPQIASRNNN